ncbi:MAG: TonB-dependent receptor plug domain-containing protein, partial [Gammaproteobacteria bacterium]
MLRLSSYLILACLPLRLIAETAPDPLIGLEENILEDMPIVLSATRLAQPLNESPVAMTVIDREMIDASGARTIPDLLRLVPGFQVGYFDGNSPVATYHGLADELSRRVQVLIDGRSVYVPALAAIQWSDLIITIEEIERIEVIRGPNAAAYGNNSFLGVISIITRQAIEDQGQKIKLTAGSHDTADAMYRFGGQTQSTDYRITLGTHNNDGTDLLNDYTHADYFSYRIDHQININTQLFYQGGYKDNHFGDHEPPPDHENQAISAFQWLRLEHTSSSNNSLSLQYYYNYNDQDMTNENLMIFFFDPIDPFPDAPISILSERHDLELNYTQNLNQLRLVSGLSARLDIVNAENVFISNDTQRHKLYRAFSHGEYRFNDSWLFNAGLMIENNDISGTDYAPRFTIIHHLNKTNSIRVGASRATRTPTLFDQNAYVRINQQLTQDGGDPLTPPNLLPDGTDVLNLVDLISPFDIESEKIESF